jgi:hypothetical protein
MANLSTAITAHGAEQVSYLSGLHTTLGSTLTSGIGLAMTIPIAFGAFAIGSYVCRGIYNYCAGEYNRGAQRERGSFIAGFRLGWNSITDVISGTVQGVENFGTGRGLYGSRFKSDLSDAAQTSRRTLSNDIGYAAAGITVAGAYTAAYFTGGPVGLTLLGTAHAAYAGYKFVKGCIRTSEHGTRKQSAHVVASPASSTDCAITSEPQHAAADLQQSCPHILFMTCSDNNQYLFSGSIRGCPYLFTITTLRSTRTRCSDGYRCSTILRSIEMTSDPAPC